METELTDLATKQKEHQEGYKTRKVQVLRRGLRVEEGPETAPLLHPQEPSTARRANQRERRPKDTVPTLS